MQVLTYSPDDRNFGWKIVAQVPNFDGTRSIGVVVAWMLYHLRVLLRGRLLAGGL